MSSKYDGKKIYLSEFMRVFDIETVAERYYRYYAENIQDPNLLEKFKEIHQDEQKHIKIAQNMVDIVKLH